MPGAGTFFSPASLLSALPVLTGTAFFRFRLPGFAQPRHVEALAPGALPVNAQGAFAPLAVVPVKSGERIQRLPGEPETGLGVLNLAFVLPAVGRAGGVDDHAAGSEEFGRSAQKEPLQADEGFHLVIVPELHDLRIFDSRAPARAGRIQLNVPEAPRRERNVLPLIGTGAGLQEIADPEVLAQGEQTGMRDLVGQHEAAGAHELGQKPCLAPRARAHVEHGRALLRRQRQGREHGRPVLDVNEAEKRGERGSKGPRLGCEAPAAGRKRLGFEAEAFFLKEGSHAGLRRLRNGNPERTEGCLMGGIRVLHAPSLQAKSPGPQVRGRSAEIAGDRK